MARRKSGSILRLHDRWLATPVLWYRHAATGRTLILVLVSHVGAGSYFETMRDRMAELEARGYDIQWEGITKAPAGEWAQADDGEQAAHQVMMTLYRDQPRKLAAAMGWVYQGDVKVPEGWAHGDLTDLELVRAIGPAAILAMGAEVDARTAKLGAHRDAYSAAMGPLMMRVLARPHARFSRALAKLAPDVNGVLLEQRSKLAAAVANPGRDQVMVWGAEHADSMDEALGAAGWAPAGRRRWLTVGRLPRRSRSAAAILGIAWAVGADTFRAAREAADAPTGRRVYG